MGRGGWRAGKRGEKQKTELVLQIYHRFMTRHEGGKGPKGLGFEWTGADWESSMHLPGQLR